HNLLFQGCRVYTSLGIFSQLNLLPLHLLIQGDETSSSRLRSEQIVYPFVINFQVTNPKQKLPVGCLPDEGENVRDGQRDYTRRGRGPLHTKSFAGSRHAVCKDSSVVPFHDSSYQTFGARIVNSRIVVVLTKDIIVLIYS